MHLQDEQVQSEHIADNLELGVEGRGIERRVHIESSLELRYHAGFA